jgi:peptidoglycan-associated lipoprotein
MVMRISGALVLATLLACASGGGAPGTSEAERDFPAEGRVTEPGLEGRAAGGMGLEASGGFKTAYFDFDDFSLRADARSAIEHNATILRANPDLKVEIQGNCDERGSEEYNLALGQRRADAAKQYLIDLGIDPSRLYTISFGEERPAVRGHNEAAWAKNRRDEFEVRR